MGGAFGKTPQDNGIVGTTRARDKAGVFGSNEAKTAPPAGSSGGAGVFGLTQAPSAAGVFGANNHPRKGVGVQGNGPEGGVSGYSKIAAGVRGHSDQGNGGEMFAHDANVTGLLATNDATTAPTATDGKPHGCGVLGVTTALGAAGVFGANISDQGVGVQGNGPHAGVSGYSQSGSGVRAFSVRSNGVEGFAEGDPRLSKFLPGLVAKASLRDTVMRDYRAGDRKNIRAAAEGATDRWTGDTVADQFLGLPERASAVRAESAHAPGSIALSRSMANAGGWLVEADTGRGKATSVGVRVSVASHVWVTARA